MLNDLTPNLTTLVNRNRFLKVLLKNPTVATSTFAIDQTLGDKPEFCKESCKTCSCVDFYTIEQIESCEKIGD